MGSLRVAPVLVSWASPCQRNPHPTKPDTLRNLPRPPATWKHGLSKHGSSIVPSKHSQIASWNTMVTPTMFTPTMFSRRRALRGRAGPVIPSPRGHRGVFPTVSSWAAYAQSPYCAKDLPAKIAWLKLSGNFPMDMIIPPLTIKILLGSKPSDIHNLSTEIGCKQSEVHK